MREKVEGTLMVIGGAEDKEGECVILKKLISLSKKREGNIVVMTAATEQPEEVGAEYIDIFNKLGGKDATSVHVHSREDANNRYYGELIEKASCIFFTGGDQLRITSLIGGTEVEKALFKAYKKGAIVAGTSAGASVMSETMITSGNDDDAPKKCTLKMAPGLGLLKDVVIDQHFAQRGRIGRLLSAIAQNPHMLGVGIDEDTAIIISSNAKFEVIGSHAVTILDGAHIQLTNVSELKPDEILAVSDIIMHVLPSGFSFDMRLRKPVLIRR